MTNYRLFEAEIAFTKAYKEYKDVDKSLREAKCMEAQMPYTFGMPHEGDLFGGRFVGYRIGFFPLMLGGRIYDGYDKLCYCCDREGAKELIKQMKESKDYSQDDIKEAEEALAFWEQEETYHHIKSAFPEDFYKNLTGDYYHTEIGAVYPLYRIAGAHLDLKKLLAYGLNGLIELIQEESKHHKDAEAQNLYQGMVQVLTVMQKLCKDRAELLRAQGYTPSLVADDLEWLSTKKPETMHQAMQLCLVYAICAGSTEMARMDDYMGPFYVRDIQEGIITREEAKTYLVNYFKIYEECFGRDTRCIIGGFGRENEEEADEMALLILDAIDGRQILYPQVSLRYYKGMNEKVYDKALDVLGKGNTFPLLYNDDVNVAGTMRAMDVSREVAEQYGFFGCGEYMLANKSIGTPNTCLNMPKIVELVLNEGIDPLTGKQIGPVFPKITEETTYEDIWARYKEGVAFFANYCGDVQALVYDKCGEQSSFLLMSILHDDCIKRGKGLFNGGLYHMGGTVETYGNMTVANSLAAIKKVVYEDQSFSIVALKEMIDKNFEGFEREHQMLADAPKYGNNIDFADEIAIAVHEDVCHNMRNQKLRTNLDSFLVVIINNNMNVLLGKRVGATPDGRLSGVYISNGNAAYPGEDKKGITALMQSLVKLDVSIHAGANTNLKFSKSLFNEQRDKMKMILETYFELGGQQGNISVVNQEDLVNAQKEPEKYQNLMVRVGGFTAQFVTLDKETQEEILARTAY